MERVNSKVIALIGGGLLAIGVFLPLVRVPKMGTLNYFNNGSGDGVIVLVLAGIAIALALFDRVKHVVWPGIACLGLIGLAFFRLQSRLSEIGSGARRELGDNPFGGVAEAATRAIQMEYGWAILGLGAIMVIAAGAMAWRSRA